MKSIAAVRAPSNAIARKIAAIQQKAEMQSVDIANVLGTRPETVSRWNQGKAFPQPDKEKLLLELEYIVDQLADLYDPTEARLWLFSRQKVLNGSTPASLIQAGRTDEVLKVIGQLLDSVYI